MPSPTPLPDRRAAVTTHPLVANRAKLQPRAVEILDKVCNKQLHNGIHYIAVIDWVGDKLFENSDRSTWKVSNSAEAQQYIFSVTGKLLQDYHYMVSQVSSRRLPDDIAALRKVQGLRVTLSGTHVYFVHLDVQALVFLGAVSWNAEDFGPWTFVGPTDSALSCRDELIGFLTSEHKSLFNPGDFDI